MSGRIKSTKEKDIPSDKKLEREAYKNFMNNIKKSGREIKIAERERKRERDQSNNLTTRHCDALSSLLLPIVSPHLIDDFIIIIY